MSNMKQLLPENFNTFDDWYDTYLAKMGEKPPVDILQMSIEHFEVKEEIENAEHNN